MRSFIRKVAFHAVSQPIVRRNRWVALIVYKVFFSNRVLPNLGAYSFFGQAEIDREIESHLSPVSKGFFVEIGSNDGLSFSNTKRLELYRGWTGLLIEPFADNVTLSRIHRSKRSQHLQAALVPHPSENPVSLIFSNLMTTLEQPSEDLKDPMRHAVAGREFLPIGLEVHRFSARALTLMQALVEAGAPKTIDFLSIDIEGMDYPVLETFDFSEYNVRFLLVEAWDKEKFCGLLSNRGFSLIGELAADNYLFRNNS